MPTKKPDEVEPDVEEPLEVLEVSDAESTDQDYEDDGRPSSELNVHEAIARVASMVGAVAKSRESKIKTKDGRSFGFMYRGIEDLNNAVAGPIHEVGLLLTPRILEYHVDQVGGNWTMVRLKILYRVTGPRGDALPKKLCPIVVGHGLDNSDKGPGKAHSYCRKVALGELFNISTDASIDNEATFYPDDFDPAGQAAAQASNRAAASQAQERTLNEDEVNQVLAEFAAIEDKDQRKAVRDRWLDAVDAKPHETQIGQLEQMLSHAKETIGAHQVVRLFDAIEDETTRQIAIDEWLATMPKDPVDMILGRVAALDSLIFSAQQAVDYFGKDPEGDAT